MVRADGALGAFRWGFEEMLRRTLARQMKLGSLSALALCISGCGGGSSGGIGSTPTPVPTPTPTPSNVDVANLKASQTFNVASARATATFDTAGDTSSATAREASITVAYDAARDSYSLTRNDRSVTFLPTDRMLTEYAGERYFTRSETAGTEYLTLVDTSYSSALRTQSVGLGFWQSSTRAGNEQTMSLDTFVYGFPTGASAVPRTGSAQYLTELFGLMAQVGEEPLTFTGSGKTTFDLARGTFTVDATVQEKYLVSGAERLGALYFTAAGSLNSGDGGFSGTFQYDGSLDSVVGTLTGSFYGPTAGEAGAVFSGSNGTGGTVVGGFTAGAPEPVDQNLIITDLRYDALFYTGTSRFFAQQLKDGSGNGYTSADLQNGQLTYTAGGDYRIAGYVEAESKFGASNRVDGSADSYAIYRKTVDGETIQLSLYKPDGPGTLKLTYTSFGDYYRVLELPALKAITRTYFMYGLDTLPGVLDARTGTATYEGIVAGAASDTAENQFIVAGTSQFQIDFTSQGYSGWLKIAGTSETDGARVDFGQFNLLAGNNFPRNAFTAGLTRNAGDSGEIQLRFYGPTGEEMAGVFDIATADGFVIGGVTAAIRK